MEAYSADRDGFVSAVLERVVGSDFLEAHHVTQVSSAIKNQKGHSTGEEFHTLSPASACRLARWAEGPTAAATLLAHAMQREGKASLFLPTNYIEGVHPDWFGGLRAKYCQPS